MSYDFVYSVNAFSMLYLVLTLCSESFKNIPMLSWLPVCLALPLQQVNFITECDSLWHTFLLQLTAVALLLASWVCIWYFAPHLLPLLRCRPFFGANNTDKDFILAILLWDLFLKSISDKFRKIKHCLMSTGRAGASQVRSLHSETAVLQPYLTRSSAAFVNVLFSISAKFLFLDFHILKVFW